MVEITLADGRKTPIPALPMELSGERLGLRRDVPRHGEHSREVLAELGYADREIDALVEAGVVGQAQGA